MKITTFEDERGNLSVVDGSIIPFEIKRIFYIYGQKKKTKRAEHAHKECEQFIISIHGSFYIDLNKKNNYTLVEQNNGLYIRPMTWVEILLDIGDICLVLASDKYDENDYIRDFDIFLKEKQ